MMQPSPTVSPDQADRPLLKLFCAAVRKLFSPAGVLEFRDESDPASRGGSTKQAAEKALSRFVEL
jgi:hypothetical protein